MQSRPVPSCGVCLSVRLSHSYILLKRINIGPCLQIVFTSGSHTILVFPYQTSWRYSDGDPPNRSIKCKWGRQKSWFWVLVKSGFIAWCHRCDRLGVINMHDAAVPWQVVTIIAGSKRRSSLMAGDDDEMFMTRSLNVTPKTTEQHLILRSDKSV